MSVDHIWFPPIVPLYTDFMTSSQISSLCHHVISLNPSIIFRPHPIFTNRYTLCWLYDIFTNLSTVFWLHVIYPNLSNVCYFLASSQTFPISVDFMTPQIFLIFVYFIISPQIFPFFFLTLWHLHTFFQCLFTLCFYTHLFSVCLFYNSSTNLLLYIIHYPSMAN